MCTNEPMMTPPQKNAFGGVVKLRSRLEKEDNSQSAFHNIPPELLIIDHFMSKTGRSQVNSHSGNKHLCAMKLIR